MGINAFDDLKPLGFTDELYQQSDPEKLKTSSLARIIAVHKERYTIKTAESEIAAEVTGKLMFSADSPLDYPCVGDWVYVQLLDDGTFAIIVDILPRGSVLRRKTSGKQIEYQLIAANIDSALIMQSLDENFNLRRLERYLVMVRDGNIEPVVLLSKSDLLDGTKVQQKIDSVHGLFPDLPVLAFSNSSGKGFNEVKQALQPEHTYCLLGSSGVGKTTLLNKLLGEARFETASVREGDRKGRHTTTQRQLIMLENGAMIIDTPGMRELGSIELGEGMEDVFHEIEALTDTCRFSDCTHMHEAGCAVLAAVESGEISKKRYDNYIKMKKESAYHARSYLEKRQRDRAFGKMVKSIMKDHDKRKYEKGT
jgi:ribosome biogenesis GTPase